MSLQYDTQPHVAFENEYVLWLWYTVEAVITHTRWWTPQRMGYDSLWVPARAEKKKLNSFKKYLRTCSAM